MPLKIRCPCGTKLVVSSRYAGRRVKCPKCSQPVEIPALAEQQAPPDIKVAPPTQSGAVAGTAAGRPKPSAAAPKKTGTHAAAELIPVPTPPPAAASPTVKPPRLRPVTAKTPTSDVVEPKPPPVQGATAGPVSPPASASDTPAGNRDAIAGTGNAATKPLVAADRSEKANRTATDTKQKPPRTTPPGPAPGRVAQPPAAAQPPAENPPRDARRPPTPPPRPASKSSAAPPADSPKPPPLDVHTQSAKTPQLQISRPQPPRLAAAHPQPPQEPAPEPPALEPPAPEPRSAEPRSAEPPATFGDRARPTAAHQPVPPNPNASVAAAATALAGSSASLNGASASTDAVPIRPGYHPSEDQVAIVRAIGISLAAVAAISAIPAVMDIIDHIRAEASPGVARWAYLVLMLAMLQSAYSAYVYQLPDWSTVWVVTLVTLVIATGYAMMLGLTFITHGDAWLVSNLDLGDVFRGGRASLWCFLMLCLTSLVSYFSGRISVRWRSELVAT